MIATDLLLQFGATKRFLAKGTILFSQGDTARFYFQVVAGEIKMGNYNDEGKEFLQGIFTEGDSFGEPPLLIDEKYPANAEALTDVELLALPKEAFFEMQRQHPETAIAISKRLATRLYYKAIMASEISSHDPEHRLLKLIDYFKEHVNPVAPIEKYYVQFTRQQLADLTGLRVETVIRSIKALEKKGELRIENRKIVR
jgi:CRP-like cAMP-binding protein